MIVRETGGGTLSGSVVSWAVGALAASASGSVQLVVRVASPLTNGTVLTNITYSIRHTESSPDSSASVCSSVASAPVLTITKSAAPSPVSPGANLTYTLAYANTGTANASGVVLSDTVPANTTFVSATGGGTLSGSVVSWAVGGLAAGASGSVQLVVRVASPLTNGTVLTNSTYSRSEDHTSELQSPDHLVTRTLPAHQTITKSAAPSPV